MIIPMSAFKNLIIIQATDSTSKRRPERNVIRIWVEILTHHRHRYSTSKEVAFLLQTMRKVRFSL